MDRYKMDYDVFAACYYPFWHGSLENLENVLSDIARTFDKKVLVVETSYTYTLEEGDGHSNSVGPETAGVKYPYSVNVQGQATAIRDIINTVAGIGAAGLGVVYWEPAWIPVGIYDGAASVWEANQKKWEAFGSGWASSYAGGYDPADAGLWYGGSSWENQAMFDFSGHPLPSLNIWKYVYYGATAPRKIESVLIEGVNANPGEAVTNLPMATVIYNDTTQEIVNVTWKTDQIEQAVAAGNGVYEIQGTAVIDGADYPLLFMLDISPINYFPDPGFEEGLAIGMWDISAPAVAGIKHEPNNAKTGEYCLHFWSEGPVEFTAEIEITGLEAGYYHFSANMQGGDVGENAEFILYAQSDIRHETSGGVTKWQEWHTSEISGIYVSEDSRSITIGISVKAAARGWGSFDDFYLSKAEE
jgi:arabinogalactan endo-1,4-beta-galactosidase